MAGPLWVLLLAEFTNPSISYLFFCRLFLNCIALIYRIASHSELIGDGRQCNLAIIYRDLKTSLKREVCGLGGESVVLTNGTAFPVPLLKVSHYQWFPHVTSALLIGTYKQVNQLAIRSYLSDIYSILNVSYTDVNRNCKKLGENSPTARVNSDVKAKNLCLKYTILPISYAIV